MAVQGTTINYKFIDAIAENPFKPAVVTAAEELHVFHRRGQAGNCVMIPGRGKLCKWIPTHIDYYYGTSLQVTAKAQQQSQGRCHCISDSLAMPGCNTHLPLRP